MRREVGQAVGRWIALGVAFAMWLAAPAAGQMTVGENTSLNLQGNAAFGYSGVRANQSIGNSNELDFGGDANLTGSYYHPQFLNFSINPYYNRNQFNSVYQSIFSASGINSFANFFSGSRTPFSVTFEKGNNSTGQFDIPGSPGIVTKGKSQLIGVNGGLNFDGLPTLAAGYSHSNDSYDILGSAGKGSGSSSVFTLGSGYQVKGISLAANYSNSGTSQTVPQIIDPDLKLEQHTYQQSLQLTANRRLPFDSANASTSYTHTHFNTDYTGSNTDASFDSVSSIVSMKPVKAMDTAVYFNYTTNSGASFLSSILTPTAAGSSKGASSAAVAGTSSSPVFTNSSNYLDVGINNQFNITDHLVGTAALDRRSQSFRGTDFANNTVNGGLGYFHALLGGQFGAHGGVSWYSGSNHQSGNGYNTGATYSRSLGTWNVSGNANWARNLQSLLIDYTSTGHGFGLNVGRTFAKQWNLTVNANYFENRVEGLNNSESGASSYGASFGSSKFTVNGSYSHSSGNALQFGAGIVPVPATGGIILPGEVILFGGNAYSFSGVYHPTRRFHTSGTYTHSEYNTRNILNSSNTILTRYDVRSEYEFRQMRLVGGFAHITQGLGATVNAPPTINTFYVGVARHFDVF